MVNLTRLCCYRKEEDECDTVLLPRDNEPKSPIDRPSLHTQKLDYLPGLLYTDNLKQKELGSQGLVTSPDGSYSYNHATSVPPSYYLNDHGFPYEINMDRGGVVTKPDGSHAAAIADGLGGHTFFSAFVAHMICDFFLRTFAEKSMDFTENSEANKELAQALFVECALELQQALPSTLHGASTALFAECVPIGARMYRLQAIALGDGAVFHINSKTQEVTQLNTISRSLDKEGKPDITSTGGCIYSDAHIEGKKNIIASTAEISEDDYVLLVTDGFLDNVRDGKVKEMIQLVAFQPFFDLPFDKLVNHAPFRSGQLPTIDSINWCITLTTAIRSSYPLPTAEQVTKRLANYTKLVTYVRAQAEERYYVRQPKKQMITTMQQSDTKSEPDAEPAYPSNEPKTDDYMIITMSPARKHV
ncbi:MAG: protein phosphatase 2C domain-containing protein [Verrucomicrobia bacterium]|nr:protein phosphatase 2C domain-containing protein [Verrucomicrobiota bacterium]